MKTPPLLFSLPLLVSVLAVQATATGLGTPDVTSLEGYQVGRSMVRDKSLISGPYAREEVSIPESLAASEKAWMSKQEAASRTGVLAVTETTTTPAALSTSKDSATTPPATTPPATTPEVNIPAQENALTEMPDVARATCETRVLRIRGRKVAVDILTDRMHVRPRQGTSYVKYLSGTKSLGEADFASSVHDFGGSDRADLIAYRNGRPRTEANKILITRRVCVRLAEGMSFARFARHSGAIVAERPYWAEEAVILSFVTTSEAIDAVDRFKAMPGVIGAHIITAHQRIPELIPAVSMFGGGGPRYAISPYSDNVDGWVRPAFRTPMFDPPPPSYLWWANNLSTIPTPAPLLPRLTEPTGMLMGGGPVNAVPSRVDLGDPPPIGYPTNRPLFSGELTDLRLPLAWENIGDFDRPVSGNMRKVLIIDDGIQKTHPDLLNAVDLNPQRHWNYYNDRALPEPLSANDTHGTSMAGIVGARIKPTGSRVCGVAPGCNFHSVVALKGFVDDFEWADAFAFSAPPNSGPTDQGGGPPEGQNRGTIKDSDNDNEWLDETRSGIVFFEVALNCQTNLGSQDATDLFPEDWLWKRAIRFSATRGAQTRGVPFVTSSGNGGDGHMDLNYMELKNCIFQIPVGGVSDMGRRIANSVGGAPLVCVAPTRGQELPPYLNWPSAPTDGPWPPNRPFQKNAPIGPDDIPFFWRRVSQGILSTTTNSGVDPDLNGTSTSAAMVAGVCALMLEVNPNLRARDMKEILLRSSRVTGDVRVDRGASTSPNDDDIIRDGFVNVTIGNQTYRLKTGQMWRMAPLGHPIHPYFGAGIVDADKAVKIAKKWKPLPFNPLPPIQMNVLDDDFGKLIGIRNTETGGQYLPSPTIRTIPRDGTPIEIPMRPPPSNMRVEHIEVRVQFHHERRGDLEITLVAPGEVGWEKGRPLESELFVPHREDYNEDRYDSAVPELNDPMDWTFSTVRHWGTHVTDNKGGEWKLRVRDAVTQGATVSTTPADPVFCPIGDPTDNLSQRIIGAGITYHGTFGKLPANDAPTVITGNLRFEPSPNTRTAQLVVDELGRNQQTGEIIFPITSWDFWSNTVTRADGTVVPNYTPVQPTAPPVDFFEFFPPQVRDEVDPTIFLSFFQRTGIVWPLQPNSPAWVSFLLDAAARPATWPAPPTSGPVGALTQRPRWVELTPDQLWIVVRDVDNNNPATNFIHMRLNRATGLLDIKPLNKGKYNISVYAENLLGLSKPKELEITVTPPGYQAWADIYFDPPDLIDPSTIDSPVSGWLADPDADGLVNGLEYALRLNPTINDPGPVPAYRIEGEDVVFSWIRDVTANDATLIPEISEDLENWGDVTAGMIPVGPPVNNLQTFEYRLPLAGEPHIYFRLHSDYNKNGPGAP